MDTISPRPDWSRKGQMTDILTKISQEEYDKLAREFFEETGNFRGAQFYHFFGRLQEQLFTRLNDKFLGVGYRLVKTDDPNKLLYRVVDQNNEAVGSGKKLDHSAVMKELMYVHSPNTGVKIPDVKLVVPEYSDARVEEIATKLFQAFMRMKQGAPPKGGNKINPEQSKIV